MHTLNANLHKRQQILEVFQLIKLSERSLLTFSDNLYNLFSTRKNWFPLKANGQQTTFSNDQARSETSFSTLSGDSPRKLRRSAEFSRTIDKYVYVFAACVSRCLHIAREKPRSIDIPILQRWSICGTEIEGSIGWTTASIRYNQSFLGGIRANSQAKTIDEIETDILFFVWTRCRSPG